MKRFLQMISRRWFVARLFLVHKRTRGSIERWQCKLFRQLFSHSIRNVPSYQKLYEEHGNDIKQIRSLKDLLVFPIITKDFFLGKHVEEYTDNSRPLPSTWKKTSGTSGRPFSLLLSPWAFNTLYTDFTCFRFLVWTTGSMRSLTRTRIARIDIRARPQKNRLFIQMQDLRQRPRESLEEIARFEPEVLASYTAILLDIAEHSKQMGIRLRPRYVVSFGEMLRPEVRQSLERDFSCEVYDRYGMGEVTGAIAIECARHDGMHVNSESVIVEIVDEKGEGVSEGVAGRVVVTDLLNFSMPFIRYDTGDRGVLIHTVCSCGLETPRLHLEGRYSAYLTFGKSKIHHLEFDGALDGLMSIIKQYQIVKIAEDRLVARIVPYATLDASAVRRIEYQLREIVGQTIDIQVEEVARISKIGRGKSLIVADESRGHQEN